MAITLREEFERHVLRMVEIGRYAPVEDALNEAFHLLDARDARQTEINDSTELFLGAGSRLIPPSARAGCRILW